MESPESQNESRKSLVDSEDESSEHSSDSGSDNSSDSVDSIRSRRGNKSISMLNRLSAKQQSALKKERRGKYGITVPLPFKFDIRDSLRARSTVDQRANLSEENRKVDGESKYVFRSKPVPAEVLQPKYE